MLSRRGVRTFSSIRPRSFPIISHSLTQKIPNGSTFTLQRVKIRKPLFTWRRFNAFLLCSIPIGVLACATAVIDIEDVEVDDQTQRVGPNGKINIERDNGSEDEDTEDDKDVWFFPFPWSSRSETPVFYKPTDPEWQEFRKFASDKERREAIEREIATQVRSFVSKHPKLGPMVGKVEIAKGRHMLEYHFPQVATRPGYKTLGLKLGNGSIELDERSHSWDVHQRVDRIINPKHACRGMWAATSKQLELAGFWDLFKNARERLDSLRSNFGVKPSSDRNGQNQNQGQKSRRSVGQGSSSPTTSGAVRESARRQMVPEQHPTPTKDDSSDSLDAGRSDSWISRLPRGLLPRGTDKAETLSVFMRHMQSHRRPPSFYRRGAIVVKGLVEVVGTKSLQTVQVISFYDPKVDEIIWIQCVPYPERPRVQVPPASR